MPVLLTKPMLDLHEARRRVLVVLNPSVTQSAREKIVQDWALFHSDPEYAQLRAKNCLGLVPILYPDGAEGRRPQFPPQGTAYSDKKDPESLYLWRWIGMLAPDVVIVVDQSGKPGWNDDSSPLTDALCRALMQEKPADVGTIGAAHLSIAAGQGLSRSLFVRLAENHQFPAGTAKQELIRRRHRTPVEVATELSQVYGHKLPSVAYIPALALIGRMRLGELTENNEHLRDVERIVRPWIDGTKDPLGGRVSGSILSGHLLFGELAGRTQKPAYLKAAQAAADLGFDESGAMREAMPHHLEMSDSVFMGTPILTQVGRLTGQHRYHDMALRHLKFMVDLNLRKDGLHQHSPVDPQHTAWGRGNGFPALGTALALSDLPDNSPHRDQMLKIFRDHLHAMLKHQDEMGMWHQVVDHHESYREFTVTCMTTFAITRGLRRGWLPRKRYEQRVQAAWEAIKSRIGPDGNLVDVCTGTGKQKNLRDYFDRTAILGTDDRGGAMALMVSTEIEFALREGALELQANK